MCFFLLDLDSVSSPPVAAHSFKLACQTRVCEDSGGAVYMRLASHYYQLRHSVFPVFNIIFPGHVLGFCGSENLRPGGKLVK